MLIDKAIYYYHEVGREKHIRDYERTHLYSEAVDRFKD